MLATETEILPDLEKNSRKSMEDEDGAIYYLVFDFCDMESKLGHVSKLKLKT